MSVIALAGCDGVGKTTYANSGVFSGLTVYREPGGSPLGEFLRSEILVNSGGFPYSDRSRKLMFLTARSALWDKIETHSDKTSCVLDRSVVCFLVYDQSFLGEVSEAAALERNLVLLDMLQIPFPDEVILLDSDPMLIARRLLSREPELLQDDLFWESWLGRSKKFNELDSMNRCVDNLAHILWFMQERYKVVCRLLLERGLINRFVIKEF